MKVFHPLLLAAALSSTTGAHAASLLDLIKPKSGTTTAAALPLTQDQMAGGLKEALGKGVTQAVTTLGKQNGFLGDTAVKILMPPSLQKAEKALRTVGQGALADEFITSMNRAAEQAVPEAAAVLGDSIKQMSIADAKSVLTGGNTAATDYFRRTSEGTIRERLLPIVKSATEKAGVTNSYKTMSTRATKALGPLGGAMLGAQMPDLDTYIANKALDGLFLKIAEQETLIRQNPVARTSELLRAVFGAK
ncbi:MAG: DUF4197 domain-containing protein [Steroidobacteraceae bacterium]